MLNRPIISYQNFQGFARRPIPRGDTTQPCFAMQTVTNSLKLTRTGTVGNSRWFFRDVGDGGRDPRKHKERGVDKRDVRFPQLNWVKIASQNSHVWWTDASGLLLRIDEWWSGKRKLWPSSLRPSTVVLGLTILGSWVCRMPFRIFFAIDVASVALFFDPRVRKIEN